MKDQDPYSLQPPFLLLYSQSNGKWFAATGGEHTHTVTVAVAS